MALDTILLDVLLKIFFYLPKINNKKPQQKTLTKPLINSCDLLQTFVTFCNPLLKALKSFAIH